MVRELLLGNHRFDQMRAATGAPPAVLAARLRTLVEHGIVAREQYREPGSRTRVQYRLTQAGRELQPVVAALMHWGDRHRPRTGGPPLRLQHLDCGADVRSSMVCEHGHVLTGVRETRAVPAPLPEACGDDRPA